LHLFALNLVHKYVVFYIFIIFATCCSILVYLMALGNSLTHCIN